MRGVTFLFIALIVVACSDDDNATSSGQPSASNGNAVTSTTAGSTTGTGASSSGGGPGAGGSGGGATGDTWSNYANGFFETYCYECHGPGDQLRDYSILDNVKLESATIRCGVANTILSGCDGSPGPTQFPIPNGDPATNQFPNAAERDHLVAWIDAGMPE